MEGVELTSFPEARLVDISFSLSSSEEILKNAVKYPIHCSNQLMTPYLGLPVENGGCLTCGTTEYDNCEGHFGYTELPSLIYHPSHVAEVKRILSSVCLSCLKVIKKGGKHKVGSDPSKDGCSICQEPSGISIKEIKNSDGSLSLELKFSSKQNPPAGLWRFLDKYGYRSSSTNNRVLLPFEVLQILKKIPEDTRKKLEKKGIFPQQGLVLKYLPVPPNCLCVPDVPDAIPNMSSDPAMSMLKRILASSQHIRKTRSEFVEFEIHKNDAKDLQSACMQYMQLRGTAKGPKTIERKRRVAREGTGLGKAWLGKIRTLFISKGSSFSSRSVITGDSYKGIDEIGLPLEIAKKITFEERVTSANKDRLQKLFDDGLCLTYRDSSCKYTVREGSKASLSLQVGQVISRRIMDGDTVFINRPPSTHKHSLQAFSVYIHDAHTVKINPLICSSFGADFDGDCIHIFYPQSLSAKAEVSELFAVKNQLLSSHNGTLNTQLVHDAYVAAKLIYQSFFLSKASAQQLFMWTPPKLVEPALLKAPDGSGPYWTILQVLQNSFPSHLDCSGARYSIRGSEILEFDVNRSQLQASLTELLMSVISKKGSSEAVGVLNILQPLFMEVLFQQGCSVGLNDFSVPQSILENVRKQLEESAPMLKSLMLESKIESYLQEIKCPIVQFIGKSSSLGSLIDVNSASSIGKVVQQLGFIGPQLYLKRTYYSNSLVENFQSYFEQKHAINGVDCSPESFGLIKSCLFYGLNPFESMIHSVATREGIVRSSRGLMEPGLLFKNLMTILRDVIICYDGTVRNICSNAVVQFKYSETHESKLESSSPAGEPVGVLAATAISNPAYKAVLEYSPTNGSSWDMMKEVLFCKCDSKDDIVDRRIILYLKKCHCSSVFCKEKAAVIVRNCLQRKTLDDFVVDFLIEYRRDMCIPYYSEPVSGLVGHLHLDKKMLRSSSQMLQEIVNECEMVLKKFRRKKHPLHQLSENIALSACEHCIFGQPSGKSSSIVPCLQFWYRTKDSVPGSSIEKGLKILLNTVSPVLLEAVVEGDPRIETVNIIWSEPSTTSWVKSLSPKQIGECAVEVVVDKRSIKHKGDAWRIVMDACLPVEPLIDTCRSIPYGIQQIHEIQGISSAFDLSVQRLSIALKNISKGILKEHLMLVGSSMACTGHLIGFNTAGYKAFFRSFDVQAPFTEATLYTPMKCFDKAAERCHKDSLSGVVASCSWGKRVSVGTGAPFDILYTDKEVILNQKEEGDVYDFLQLVTSANCVEPDNSCLGTDAELLENEFRNLEPCMSPPGSCELTFDEEMEGPGSPQSAPNGNGWGGWDATKEPSKDVATSAENDSWNGEALGVNNKDALDSWGGKASDSENGGAFNEKNSWAGHASKSQDQQPNGQWGAVGKHNDGSPDQERAKAVAWGECDSKEEISTKATPSPSGKWTSQMSGKGELIHVDVTEQSGLICLNESINGDEPCHSQVNWSDSKNMEDNSHQKSEAWNGWGANGTCNQQDNVMSLNNVADVRKQDIKSRDISSQGWDLSSNQEGQNASAQGWGSSQYQESQDALSQGWSLSTNWEGQNASSQDWGSCKENHYASHSQTDVNNYDGDKDTQLRPDPPGFSSKLWASTRTSNDTPARRKFDSRKSFNSNPRAAPGEFVKENIICTATGIPLGDFTSEEKQIVSDIDLLVNAARRIMHDSGYTDGDRLSLEHQDYVLENIFKHHPDPDSKVGDGVDFIKVDKHSEHQNRCFHVVAINGSAADFSYLKCLKNFVKEKYPEDSEVFNSKYFEKRPINFPSKSPATQSTITDT